MWVKFPAVGLEISKAQTLNHGTIAHSLFAVLVSLNAAFNYSMLSREHF